MIDIERLRPRVLVTVDGGVAYVNVSEGVEVVMIDYDNHEVRKHGEWVEVGTSDERYAGLPDRFKGLQPADVEEF